MAETAIDPTEYPRYLFHPTEKPQRVETPDDEWALEGDWRRQPYSEAEKVALLRTEREERQQQGAAVAARLSTPVTEELPDAIATRNKEQAQLKHARAAEQRKARYERDKQRRETNQVYTDAREVLQQMLPAKRKQRRRQP